MPRESKKRQRKTLNPYGSQIISKWIHIRAIRKRTLWCCAVLCYIAVNVETDSGVFKIDPIESAYVFYYICTMYIDVCLYGPMYSSGECVITFVRKRGETKWTPETKFFIFEKIPRKSRRIRKWKTQNRKRAATQIIHKMERKKQKEKEEERRKKSIVDISARRVSESEMNWMLRSIHAYKNIHVYMWVSLLHTYDDDMLRLLCLCMWWKCGWTLLRCQAMSVSRI